MPDLRLGNVFQLPSRRISRRWTRRGTNLVIFLGALCAQTNLFRREMKIKKMYLKSNTRQENFRTFEESDILNGIKSDQLPAEKTSLRGMVLPVKSLCVLSWFSLLTGTKFAVRLIKLPFALQHDREIVMVRFYFPLFIKLCMVLLCVIFKSE